MRVALIVLPHPYIAHPLKHQPLGILYLAAALEEAGYDVEIIDLRTTDKKDCLARLPEADVYGMGATTLDYKTAVSLTKEIKNSFSKPVILGGVHATALPETIDPIFDSLVLGEGELAIIDLLYDLEHSSVKRFYRRELIQDIDSIPLPARHLLPYESIVSTELMEGGMPATSFISSRGCPFDCRFCAVHTMWKGVRYRSIDKIADEIKEVMRTYQLRHLKFQDDTLTLSKKRLLKLCQALQPVGIEWMANARVDCVDQEMLEAMRQAGCTWIEFGIESASQEALNIINKGFTLEQAERAIREAKSLGLKVKELFMIGLPGESNDISDLDIDFITRTDPESAIMATFVPLPGCSIFQNPQDYGINILTHDYDRYLTNLGLREGELEKGFVYEHPTMTREEMMRHRQRVIEFIKERQWPT